MRKLLWTIIGLGAAFGAVILADQQSAAVLSGGAGLHVLGTPIGTNVQGALMFASWAVVGLSAAFLAIAFAGYVFNYLSGHYNKNTDPLQVIFLLAALVVCGAAFGAVYKPLGLGLNPYTWLTQSPQWWILALMMAPVGFLLINLVLGLFWSNEPTVSERLNSLEQRMVGMQTTVQNRIDTSIAKIDAVAVATKEVLKASTGTQNNTIALAQGLGYKLVNDAWTAPAKAIPTQIDEMRTSIGQIEQVLKPKPAAAA